MHDPDAMKILTTIVFRTTKKTTHAQCSGHIEGAVPPIPVVQPRVFLDVCTSVGREERDTNPQPHRDVGQALQTIAVAQGGGKPDLFTLRWFTFVCLWICPQLCLDLQKNAPHSVKVIFFDAFPGVMRTALFQQDCVKTPLEIVTHLMILLRISYDSI
jgi:hypothetical protein